MMRCRSFMCSPIRAATSGWSLQRRWVVRIAMPVANSCWTMSSRWSHSGPGWSAGCRRSSSAWPGRPRRSRRARMKRTDRDGVFPSASRGAGMSCWPGRGAAAVASCGTGRGPDVGGSIRGWPPPAGVRVESDIMLSSHRRSPPGHRGQRPWVGCRMSPIVVLIPHGGGDRRSSTTTCGDRTERRPGCMTARDPVAFNITRGDGGQGWGAPSHCALRTSPDLR